MKRRIPALIGGAVGLATAAAAAGVVHERRVVGRERSRIDPATAALFGSLPVDRESRVLAEDGVALHVEEVGPLDAPLTVVFVHGFALNLGSFHYQRRRLTDEFGDSIRMVFYDQRSHGRSAKSASDNCTIEQLGRDLAAVIDSVCPDGAVALVGHSMGGMTVMSFADQYPNRFHRADRPDGSSQIRWIALINTSGGNLKTVTLGLPNVVARLRGPLLPMVLRRAAHNVDLVEKGRALGKDLAWVITKKLSFGSDDVDPAVVAFCTNMIAGTPVDVIADFYPTLMEHDGTEGLRTVRDCTALVIGATKDAMTPVAHTQHIATALPNAELLIVPGAGHLLMLERPEAVDVPLVELVNGAARYAAETRRSSRRGRRRMRAAGE